MKLSDFDFELDEELIALRPLPQRSSSRLLVQSGPTRSHAYASDLPDFLEPGDLLVFNDTRVIPARLFGQRIRGNARAKVEITLTQETEGLWDALAKPLRKLKSGDTIEFGPELRAGVVAITDDGRVRLEFSQKGPAFLKALGQVGVMPLPPYIAAKRPADALDNESYQPVFARRDGAIAAPTASLHFDDALLSSLQTKGTASTFVTLHVGIGTFLPVKTDNIADHVMHAEWGEISPSSAKIINDTKANGGRIIPVGTTALRLLEAAGKNGQVHPWRGDTDIFITPGYEFQIVDGLMTNFHLPKSTLMMLVSALMGRDLIMDIYADAIARKYRFFSYGDASLLIPQK